MCSIIIMTTALPLVSKGGLHVFNNNNNDCFAIGFYQRWQHSTLPCLSLIEYKWIADMFTKMIFNLLSSQHRKIANNLIP